MEQRSKHTASADASRVDYLLGVLSTLSQDDPPPALRARLDLLSSTRLSNGPLLLRLKPTYALALLAAILFTAVFTARLRRPSPLQTKIESRVAAPAALFDRTLSSPPAAPSPITHHPLRKWTRYDTAQTMTVRLPYSDAAIDTGTDATIRVSMSQAELAALGFPINTTLHDRRVLAQLTLGDDGLPRAISVSLPLELVKEKK